MPTQDYAASIQGVSIRVTRLDAAGNLLNGAGDSYTTSAFMRVSFTPEYEEGEEITEKGANGVICVSYKAPDTLKRITMELAICEPDPELSQLLSGGLLLRKTVNGEVKSVGWSAPGVGDDPAGNGVAIECWSHAVKGGKRAATLPYFHWVFPYAKMRQSGDRVIENGMLANTFEGYGLGNPNFGAGPDGRWEFPVAAERPYSYARASYAPVSLQGFYTWSDSANNTPESVFFTKSGIQGATSQTITSIVANANIATVTMSNVTAAGIANDDFITISGAGDLFDTRTNTDGVYTFNSAGVAVSNVNATTFTYVTTDSVGATAITATLDKFSRVTVVNQATEAPSYSVVTTAALDTKYGGATANSASAYNVPGSIVYNPDNNVDFVIRSNES
jgi:hypothetical protein